MLKSQTLAHEYPLIVTCDISDFYSRLSHHRLENALKQLNITDDTPARILDFLSNFSNTYSYGLPVGGPAARILSELVLNQIDRLLKASKIRFARFADDFHIFVQSREDAYRALIFLSEKLLRNQGLALQKSKTRILTASEFLSLGSFALLDANGTRGRVGDPQEAEFLGLHIRYDPYSPTAEDDYAALREELSRFDIVGMLKSELTKSRIHIALARKITSAIRFIDTKQRDDAVITLIENIKLLYPVFPIVMLVTKEIFDDLSEPTKEIVLGRLRTMILERSEIMQIDLHVAYAIRVLACKESPESIELFNTIFRASSSNIVRRDIILTMARWRNWTWLSDVKNDFRSLGPWGRRAFIVASYFLSDEGAHWRQFMKAEFSPFELEVRDWAAGKVQLGNWSVPI